VNELSRSVFFDIARFRGLSEEEGLEYFHRYCSHLSGTVRDEKAFRLLEKGRDALIDERLHDSTS
jgi:hypothetical protein